MIKKSFRVATHVRTAMLDAMTAQLRFVLPFGGRREQKYLHEFANKVLAMDH